MTSISFSVDWTTVHTTNFERLLSTLKNQKHLNFLEIGTWEGRTSQYLVKEFLQGEHSQLYTVDNAPKDLFFEILKRHKDKITHHNQNSALALAQLMSQQITFDFIYVDGSHVAPHVLSDGVMSFHLLKDEGIMLFDDYLWELPEYINSVYDLSRVPSELHKLFKPRQAIDTFLEIYKGQYELIFSDYQLAIKKTATLEKQYKRPMPLPYQF